LVAYEKIVNENNELPKFFKRFAGRGFVKREQHVTCKRYRFASRNLFHLKNFERQGITYELLLEIFSMKKTE